MNVPRPGATAPALSDDDSARVLSISKPSPKAADRVREAAHAVPQTTDRDSFAVTALADLTDRSLHAAAARCLAAQQADLPAGPNRAPGAGSNRLSATPRGLGSGVIWPS